jgi:hypothetical protein
MSEIYKVVNGILNKEEYDEKDLGKLDKTWNNLPDTFLKAISKNTTKRKERRSISKPKKRTAF